MNADTFNKLIDKYAAEKLIPLGFKKSGVHYYLYNSPNILVLHKNTFRGSFMGFYAAITYDFISNTKDKKGLLKVPPYIEDFPITLYIEDIPKKFKKYKQIDKFSLKDENEIGATEGIFVRIFEPLPNIKDSEEYINKAIDILISDGLNFFNQCNPKKCIGLLIKNKSKFLSTIFYDELKSASLNL